MARDTEVVRLAVIPGDGIGPEVVAATVPVLRTALETDGGRLDVTPFDWGGESPCTPVVSSSGRRTMPSPWPLGGRVVCAW